MLVFSVSLLAETTNSKLEGTILDATGKAINAANVTVKNRATGATKSTHTDAVGHYSVDELAAGSYSVEATAPGFALSYKNEIKLAANQSQQVAFTLSVDSVVQDVTVLAGVDSIAAEAAPSGGYLEQRSAQSLVSNTYIENFTSPIADYGEIVQIVPGAYTTSANGVGLGQSKTYFRGFADGNYDIDFDGIPFFDSNSPSHHSWAFFPSQWVGGVDFDRSPGTASTVGPSPFGGTIHLLPKPLGNEMDFRGTASWGSWNTELFDAAFNSGAFGPHGKLNMWADYHHMTSNGFQTQNYNQRDGGSLILQYQLSPKTVITGFAGVIQLSTNGPNISSTRCQLYGAGSVSGNAYTCNSTLTANGLLPYTGSGIKFLLTKPNASDPANWFSSQYNQYHIPTDFEYVALKSEFGHGWYLDVKPYTYNYDNGELYSNPTAITDVSQAAALANPSLVPGTYVTGGKAYYLGTAIASCNNTGLTAAANATTAWGCGVDKYNSYRKYGETSVITQTSKLGVFRTGMWYEWARTDRHQFPTDPSQNWLDQALPNFNEQFWTNSYQPFAEYEFHATPQLNITPGIKFFDYSLDILHHADNGATVGLLTCPANLNATCSATATDSGSFTAWLPTLDANYRFAPNWSGYAQVATGSNAPPSSVYDYNHTVSTTNPVPGLATPPKQQKSTTYQVGTVYKGNRITLDVDAFRVRFQNSYSSTTDITVGDPLYGQSIYYLQPSSVTQGLEFESTAVLTPGLNLYLNATAGNAYYSGSLNAGTAAAPYFQKAPSGLWVAQTPSDTEMMGLTYQKHGFDLGIYNHRIGEERLDNKAYHNQAIIAPFSTANTYVNYTIRNHSFFDQTKIRFSVNNLLDAQNVTTNKLATKATTTTFVGTNGVTYTDQFTATTGYTSAGADTPTIMAGRSINASITFGIAPFNRKK